MSGELKRYFLTISEESMNGEKPGWMMFGFAALQEVLDMIALVQKHWIVSENANRRYEIMDMGEYEDGE